MTNQVQEKSQVKKKGGPRKHRERTPPTGHLAKLRIEQNPEDDTYVYLIEPLRRGVEHGFQGASGMSEQVQASGSDTHEVGHEHANALGLSLTDCSGYPESDGQNQRLVACNHTLTRPSKSVWALLNKEAQTQKT